MNAFAAALPFTSRLPAFNLARAAFSGEDREAEFRERRVAFLRRFLPEHPLQEVEALAVFRLRPPARERVDPKPCVATS